MSRRTRSGRGEARATTRPASPSRSWWAAPGQRRRTACAATALGLLALVLYLALLQRGLHGDGYFILRRVERGTLLFNHLLYHPLVAGLGALLSPVGAVSAEGLIKLMSALAGGVSVALTCALGAVVGRGLAGGVLAAATLACLPGTLFHATATEYHAFHAAFAAFLLFVLVRLVEARGAAGTPRPATLFLAALLTPASHLSGLAAALPALAAARAAGPLRRRAGVALGAGFATLAAVYAGLHAGPWLVEYTRGLSRVWLELLAAPQNVPHLMLDAARELLVPSAPASALAPAGLWVLRRRRPALALVLGLWVLAWWLLCFPIGEDGLGTYYLPTFPALAVLAVVAARELSARGPVGVLLLLAAFLPAVPVSTLGRFTGVVVWLAVSALGVLAVARVPRGRRRRGLAALPAVLCLAVVPAWLRPTLQADPARDRMRALARANRDPAPLVLLLETEPMADAQWKTLLPREIPQAQVVNLLSAEVAPPRRGAVLAQRHATLIDTALADGQDLWLVGALATDRGALERTRYVGERLAALRQSCRWSPLGGADRWIWRLSPR